MVGILQQLLNEYHQWGTNTGKWTDDALIEDFNLDEDRLAINGVMIWGAGKTAQWVEPFYFDVALTKSKSAT